MTLLASPDTSSAPAEPATETAASLPSVAAILFGLENRGLSIRLTPAGDGIKLYGPQEARTEKIKATLKAAKPQLIAHLREQAEAENTLRAESILREENQGCVFAPLVQEESTSTVQFGTVEQPLPFPLPEIIRHEDPAAYWRDYNQSKSPQR